MRGSRDAETWPDERRADADAGREAEIKIGGLRTRGRRVREDVYAFDVLFCSVFTRALYPLCVCALRHAVCIVHRAGAVTTQRTIHTDPEGTSRPSPSVQGGRRVIGTHRAGTIARIYVRAGVQTVIRWGAACPAAHTGARGTVHAAGHDARVGRPSACDGAPDCRNTAMLVR